MKKLLILILALVMCLALTSCDQIQGIINGIINPQPPVTETQADAAITLLKSSYKDWNKTASDYTLEAYTHQGEVKVEWSVNVDENTVKVTADYDKGVVTVDVNEESAVDVAYVLTAKVTDSEGNVRTISFNLVLPKDKLTTYDELVAAEKDATLKVQGIVVGIIKKSDGWQANSLYIQDEENKGGYYAYNLADGEIAGVEVGMTVKVTGTKDTYNGIYEVMKGKVTIVDTTIKTVTPVDYTEVFTNAADTKAEDLIYRQSMLVTVKGVEITTQDVDNGYLNFKLAGKEAYVRISSSNNCITKAEADALKALHASSKGSTADVTGIIQLYNGAFYLIPATGVDAISNIQEPTRTDAEKIDFELDSISIPSTLSTDTVLDLSLVGKKYDTVTFSWSSNSANAVVGEDGKLTVTVPETDTTVKLTLVVTCGNETKTKEYEIVLSRKPLSVGDALNVAEGVNVYVKGEVVEIKEAWSSYNNMSVWISDGTNKILVFRTVTQVNLGDIIEVRGVMGSYSGTKQIAKGSTAVVVDPAPVKVTIPEANELADGRRVIITGEVVEIKEAWSSFNNMSVYISDGTNTFYVFRMKTQVKLGDVITVTGKMGTYKGARQIAAGATATIKAEEAPTTGTKYVMGDVFGTTANITVTQDVATADGLVTYHLVASYCASNKDGTYRVYQAKSGVISTAKGVATMSFEGKGKDGNSTSVKIEVSNDGSNWVTIDTITVAKQATHTVDFGGTYTYIKISSADKQLQIKNMTFGFTE